MPRFEATDLGDGVPRPVLLVSLETAKGTLDRVPGLVDSGADQTLVPWELLDTFGIRWEDLVAGRRGQGAGGGFERRECPGVVSWKNWKTSPLVVAEPGNLPILLLGRLDFFTEYVVRFSWHQAPQTFQVDPVTGPKKRR